MCRICVAATFAICLIASVVQGAHQGANVVTFVDLVPNPGFEKPDPKDRASPAGFISARAGKSRKAKFAWEEPGYRSRRCVSVETMDSDDLGYWKTTIPVKPETEYFISFYYKCRSATHGDIGKADPVYHQGRPGGPNLELGVVPETGMETRKPTHWTDTAIPLGPDGGTYVPVATEWAFYRETVKTVAGQKKMEVKLRVYCYVQKVWFDDLRVVELPAGPPLPKRPTPLSEYGWRNVDTTPPVVNLQTPAPGASVGKDSAISAQFADAGSGIDAASVGILLDGKDVSRQGKARQTGFTLRPQRPLAQGIHKVEVTVSDKAGNPSNHLVWRFGVEAVRPLQASIENGVFLVDGEPYFPVGIYAASCFPNDEGRFRESALAEAAAAGFDCLMGSCGDRNELDILLKHRMRNLVGIFYEMAKVKDAASAEAVLLKGRLRARNHPTTLAYWSEFDSQDPSYLVKIVETRKVLKKYDPKHPLIYCGSVEPRRKPFIDRADIVLPYRYPIPTYHPIMNYGWTLALAYKVAGGKPVWFLPQAFSHAMDRTRGKGPVSQDEFRPTAAEMRAMTYFSVVTGVKGVILYALHLPHLSLPAIWKEVLREGGELRYLAPVLAGSKPVRTASLKRDSTYGSIYFREWEHNGAHTLIAVNMSGGPVAATWQFKKPTRAIVLFEDRAMAEKSTSATDLFEPWQVHIYRWE